MNLSPTDCEKLLQNTLFLLFVLLKKLRFSFIYCPDIRKKIAISNAMQDCKFAIETFPETNMGLDPRTFAFIDPNSAQSVGLLICGEGALDFEAYRFLIAQIDGNTTHLEICELKLAAATRRAIENAAGTFSFRLPPPAEQLTGLQESVKSTPLSFPWPELPTLPGRPAIGSEKQKRLDARDGMLTALYEQMFTIEFPAGEVCAALPLRFPELPIEVDLVLAQQTYEEGRHANLVLSVFESLGGALDDFEPCFDIWNNSFVGVTIAECLCIENFLGEGYALGSDNMEAEKYRKIGNRDMENIYLSLQADEIMHVKQGITWFRKIAGRDAQSIIDRLETIAVCPPPDPWFNPELRRFVGFNENDITRQRKYRDKLFKRVSGTS